MKKCLWPIGSEAFLALLFLVVELRLEPGEDSVRLLILDFAELLNQIFLFLSQALRELDLDSHIFIALAVTVRKNNAGLTPFQSSSRFCASRNIQVGFSVHGRNRNGRA